MDDGEEGRCREGQSREQGAERGAQGVERCRAEALEPMFLHDGG
jgi:hypothetical protein